MSEDSLAEVKDGRTVLVSVLRTCDNPETCHALTRDLVFTTLGINDLDNTGLDRWQLVGWDWETGDLRQFEIYGDKDEEFEVLAVSPVPEGPVTATVLPEMTAH